MSHHQEHSLEQDLALAKEWSKPEFLPPDQEPGKHNGWRHTCYRLAKYIEDHIKTKEVPGKNTRSQDDEEVWIVTPTLSDFHNYRRKLRRPERAKHINRYIQVVGCYRPVTIFLAGQYQGITDWPMINRHIFSLLSRKRLKNVIKLP